ncbi:MAG: hypothetical protein GXZ06_06885 [Tissierellia bacterium]|nr:hypothetical protein [Tissierellia bacterium]
MKRKLLLLIFSILILNTLTLTAIAVGEEILQGSIEAIDYAEGIISILDYDGNREDIKLLPTTKIEIEGESSSINQLYFGQEVDIYHRDNEAIKIVAYPEDDPERYGYIMPGSRFKTGRVLFLTEDEIEIKNGEKREKYRITPATTVYKKGETTSIIRIKEGDKVLLTFDNIYSSEVSSIKVEDEEEHIKGILSGKLTFVDNRKKEIHIQSPHIYKDNNSWVPYGDHILKLKVNNQNLYNGIERINLSDLDKFKGQTVYVAYSLAYGRPNVAKLQVKTGSSRVYDSKIQDIEYGTGRMIVNKNLIHFNEGTIVVKDNRLVDILNMNLDDMVRVNVDFKYGISYASLVAINGSSILNERVDNTRLSIYIGRIEDIFEYEIEIGSLRNRLNHLKLTEEGLWKEERSNIRVAFTEDTLIYDSQLKEIVPVQALLESRYFDLEDIKNITLRNRLRDNFYKDKIAYFVVRESSFGKELLALNIVAHISNLSYDINHSYSTIGNIKEINHDEGKISLTNVRNFNTLNKNWESTSDQVLDISQAIILYNDIPIPMDKLYTLRQGLKVYVIKYKSTSEDIGYVILIED